MKGTPKDVSPKRVLREIAAAIPAEARKVKAAFASSPAAIEAGKVLYTQYCRFCHGNTGLGDSTMAPKNMKPSNLADATWTRGSSEGEIFWVIQNGAPPKYDMKGLKGKVTDADTWNIVHYVRSGTSAPSPTLTIDTIPDPVDMLPLLAFPKAVYTSEIIGDLPGTEWMMDLTIRVRGGQLGLESNKTPTDAMKK